PGLFLAKALYDNIAETPDELAFRRGDVLTVLEQDTKGLEGWWLCSLRNKHGIAPGNRLKIVSGMGEAGGSSLDLTK
ncbi:protein YSC84, partial [Biomphalaria glabrata]